MKITVLNENYVDKQNLCGEHGLSFLIETASKNILFDTGQNFSVVNNYKYLVDSNKRIDSIVLSHGHYDHTGGLAKNPDFFINLSKKVIATKYIFDKHLRKTEDRYEFIGLDRENVKKFDFVYVEKELKLSDNITIYSNINREFDFVADLRLFCEIEGNIIKDPFRDELYMVIKENDKTVLITGCSHAGIMNIVNDYVKRSGDDKIDYLVGGMHLFRSDEETIRSVVKFFQSEVKVKSIITGHCTGLDAFYKLKEALSIPIFYMKTGEIFDI